MPAAVVFSIASRPGLNAHEANDLAQLLTVGEHGRNLAAIGLARRIRDQAAIDFAAGEASSDIELDRDELEQIATLFVDAPDLLEKVPAYAHLNGEVIAELARRSAS